MVRLGAIGVACPTSPAFSIGTVARESTSSRIWLGKTVWTFVKLVRGASAGHSTRRHLFTILLERNRALLIATEVWRLDFQVLVVDSVTLDIPR